MACAFRFSALLPALVCLKPLTSSSSSRVIGGGRASVRPILMGCAGAGGAGEGTKVVFGAAEVEVVANGTGSAVEEALPQRPLGIAAGVADKAALARPTMRGACSGGAEPAPSSAANAAEKAEGMDVLGGLAGFLRCTGAKRRAADQVAAVQ